MTPEFFDQKVDEYEKLMEDGDFKKVRKQLFGGMVSGNILEIGPGPGMNFDLYPKGSEITVIEYSEKMLRSLIFKAQDCNIKITPIRASVENILIEDPRLIKNFDYVISTCTLCCMSSPDKILEKMCNWTREGGEIRLFEHGLHKNFLIGLFQHLFDVWYYKKEGCHCNRDIRKIIRSSPASIKRMWNPCPLWSVLTCAILKPY